MNATGTLERSLQNPLNTAVMSSTSFSLERHLGRVGQPGDIAAAVAFLASADAS